MNRPIKTYSAKKPTPKKGIATLTGISSSSTTTSSTGSSSGNNSANNLKLCLLGHCIFCLKKLKTVGQPRAGGSKSKSAETTFSEAKVGPEFLSIFNLVWPYMGKKNNWNEEKVVRNRNTDCIGLDTVMMKSGGKKKCSEPTGTTLPTVVASSPKTSAIVFARLPTLCQSCADMVQHVENLMKTVRCQVDMIRQAITETKKGGQHSWRSEEFEKALRNAKNLGIDVVEGTLKILNDLGDCPGKVKKTDANIAIMEISQSRPVVIKVYTSKRKAPPQAEKSVKVKSFKVAEVEQMEIKVEVEESKLISQRSVTNEFDKNHTNEHDDRRAPDCMLSQSANVRAEIDTSFMADTFEGSPEEGMSCDEEDDIKPELPVPIESDVNATTNDEDPLASVGHNDGLIPKRTYNSKGLQTFTEAEFYLLRPYKCKEEGCMKSFDFENSLVFHQKKAHWEKYAPFRCTCGRTFTTKKLQRQHSRRCPQVNGGEVVDKMWGRNKQKCEICNKRINLQDILEHVRGHVGDYAVKCSTCSRVFSNTKSLKVHCERKGPCQKRKKDVNLEYECNTCEFKTKNRCALRGHIRRHHERANPKFSCPIANCDKMFSVRQSVDFHLSEHCRKLTVINTQNCEICSEAIYIEEIESHLKDTHKIGEIIKCKQCPKMFSAWPSLLMHMRVHRTSGLVCDICNEKVKYTRFLDFLRHYETEHQIKCQPNVCEFCSKEFLFKERLKYHIQLNHSDGSNNTAKNTTKATVKTERKRYSCDICFGSVTYLSDTALIFHKIQVHGHDPFTCKTCGATFLVLQALSRHQKEHAGVKFQKEFRCLVDGCGKVFKSSYKLKYHKRTNHGAKRTHPCQLCEKAYFDVHSLKRHHEKVHLQLRPFVCEDCGESFASPRVLKIHRLIHTGERPYECPLCGQRFRHKEVLKRHEKAHELKGSDFKPNGPMKNVRKRIRN